MTRDTALSEVENTALQTLHDKYLQPIAESCATFGKGDFVGLGECLKNFSKLDPSISFNSEQFNDAVTARRPEGFAEVLAPFKFAHLVAIDTGFNVKKIAEEDRSEALKHLPLFYKVKFDPKSEPIVTPLDRDGIWDVARGGLDPETSFTVVNPGLTGTNTVNLIVSGVEKFEETVGKEAKSLEKGMIENGLPKGERQYLITVNDQASQDQIIQHNQSPEGFITPYAKEQARVIYGPLITEGGITLDENGVAHGTALPPEKIVANLSRARNVNGSYGTVTANCQTNALVAMMGEMGIASEVIEAGVTSMRRVDIANVAKTSEGIFPSTVIIEGANDKLAKRLIERSDSEIPFDHEGTSAVRIDDHRIKVYVTNPVEVYDPRKKPTEEQKQEENRIVQTPIEKVGTFTVLPQEQEMVRNKVLNNLGLDGFRFKESDTHYAPHFTMPETPGNKVDGSRDENLFYKLAADMMTRTESQNVSQYFGQQKIHEAPQNSQPTQSANFVGESHLATTSVREENAKGEITEPSNLDQEKWTTKFPSKKSAEAEELSPQKKSWKDVLDHKGNSKDDSTITR